MAPARGEALMAAVPAHGAVIGYNAAFERARILALAAAWPDLADALGGIADLLPVARATWYHRDQRGSWSIKTVLPTVAPELDHSGLEVGDGSAAQQAYLDAVAPDAGASRRSEIDAALRAYCRRDTEAMMVVARRLCGSGAMA